MNKLNHKSLGYSDTLENQGWRPYLTFNFVSVSHQFNPTPFFREYQDRKVIRDKVWELHNKGWGYTKIHHNLVDNNYDIGKSRIIVDSMIKKRIKREQFFNQEIKLDTYVDFGLEVYRD